jgi:hypothetical protein
MAEAVKIKGLGWTMGLMLVMLMLFLQQCNENTRLLNEANSAKEKAERELNNFLAAEQTIERFVNENNLLVSKVRSYEFDITDLTLENERVLDKYNVILSENKKLKGINSLLSAEINLKDSLLASVTIDQIDEYTGDLRFDDYINFENGNSRRISGELSVTLLNGKYSSTPISIVSSNKISLIAAVKESNGSKYLEIGTSHPGVAIQNVENIGVVNSQLNKRYNKESGWAVGLGVNYGVGLKNGNTVTLTPCLGVGLYWSPKWLKF